MGLSPAWRIAVRRVFVVFLSAYCALLMICSWRPEVRPRVADRFVHGAQWLLSRIGFDSGQAVFIESEPLEFKERVPCILIRGKSETGEWVPLYSHSTCTRPFFRLKTSDWDTIVYRSIGDYTMSRWYLEKRAGDPSQRVRGRRRRAQWESGAFSAILDFHCRKAAAPSGSWREVSLIMDREMISYASAAVIRPEVVNVVWDCQNRDYSALVWNGTDQIAERNRREGR